MKAFIGKYFKTANKAIKAYNKMSKTMRKMQSVCEVGGGYFIVGNSTIKALKEKRV